MAHRAISGFSHFVSLRLNRQYRKKFAASFP
jgi:hypothetical protein